ncbi:MAG TPA: RnfH family protein [Steroidobacteraceae bacterium]|nr:RnfH family protein [Steroidobacteraceae bacterium]
MAYATPERQYTWTVELPASATVQQALVAARCGEDIPWESAAIGIFGEPVGREHVPRDGDRIEILRPLQQDPKLARRERARRQRIGR